MSEIGSCYEGQLKIWVVGVRDKNSNGSIWSDLWKPTSLKWFGTRRQCREYIRKEINKDNFEWLEYKPLRYGPVTR